MPWPKHYNTYIQCRLINIHGNNRISEREGVPFPKSWTASLKMLTTNVIGIMISHNLSSDMKTAQFCGKEVNPLALHHTAYRPVIWK
jgi:hypothetical protein